MKWILRRNIISVEDALREEARRKSVERTNGDNASEGDESAIDITADVQF